MSGARVVFENGVWNLVGRVDEAFPYQQIVASNGPGPVRLDFAAVELVTSFGQKILIDLMEEVGEERVELYEVPVSFVINLNFMPALLLNRPERVKTFYAPFHCDQCSLDIDSILKFEQVVINNEGVSLPRKRCHSCLTELRLNTDPYQYFLFIYN